MAAASDNTNTLIFVALAAAGAYAFRDKIAAAIKQNAGVLGTNKDPAAPPLSQTVTTRYSVPETGAGTSAAPPPAAAAPPPAAAAPAAAITPAKTSTSFSTAAAPPLPPPATDANGCYWDPAHPTPDAWVACTNAANARKAPPPPPPPPPSTANACLDAAGWPYRERTYDQTVALFRSCGVYVNGSLTGITSGSFRLLPTVRVAAQMMTVSQRFQGRRPRWTR